MGSELWNLPTILTKIIFFKMCRVKSVCGFMLSTIKIWGKEQSTLIKFDNEVERLIKLLHHYQLEIASEIIYDLPVSSGIEKTAQDILERHGLREGQIIAFVPGAKRDINEWPLNYFVNLQKLLKKRYPECKIVILGGLDDVSKGEYIQYQTNDDAVINLAGKTSLMELIYLIGKCQLVITNNTGTMHMASLAGVKVVGIFSSAELYGKWFAYGNEAISLYKHIDCEACYYKCNRDKECIKNITPEDVLFCL
jgi:ADP-heptose:LPS heptosyltransferase